ncbi:MAG: heme exporter protein CcmD [Pseudomonadota bacterium]
MMPDLGKYAQPVLWSYAASIAVLVVIVAASLIEGRRVRAEMRRAEEDRDV